MKMEGHFDAFLFVIEREKMAFMTKGEIKEINCITLLQMIVILSHYVMYLSMAYFRTPGNTQHCKINVVCSIFHRPVFAVVQK